MSEWRAEIVADEALARRLVGGQFPDLDGGAFCLLGEGWDNTVWLVDERWVFRFPRRAVAVPAVERQRRILPALAGRLPLPVPCPVFGGRPGDGFPWPFFGCELLPGRELADAALDEASRRRLAEPLGRFLRALHRVHAGSVPGAPSLPVDPMGRADMAFRVPRTRARLVELAELDLWQAPPGIGELLAEAEALAAPPATVIAHGDLHLRHLLVDGGGVPSAVIDWDDLCLADPSVDLVLYWCALPPSARGAFVDAYGPVERAALVRARVLALFLSGTLAVYGRQERIPALEREAVRALELAARD